MGQLDSWASWIIEGVGKHNGVTQDLSADGRTPPSLEDFKRWGIPWNVKEGDLEDLKRGPYLFMDDSAVKRFGRFSVGEYREILGRRR